MKLTLLEDGVLDYKGDGAVLATPNAVPVGALGARIKNAAPEHRLKDKNRFEQHIQDCPACGDKLCDIGEKLARSL